MTMTRAEVKRRIIANEPTPGVPMTMFNAVLTEVLAEARPHRADRTPVTLMESRQEPSPHERLRRAFRHEAADPRPVSGAKPDPLAAAAAEQPMSMEQFLSTLTERYGVPPAAETPRPTSRPYVGGFMTLREQDDASGFTAAHPTGLTERDLDLARARLRAAVRDEAGPCELPAGAHARLFAAFTR